MPFTHKVKQIEFSLEGGSEHLLEPGWVSESTPAPAAGDRLYLFCDDSKKGARDGGLRARATIVSVAHEDGKLKLTVEFSEEVLTTRLFNHQLDSFKKSGSHDVGPFRSPIMTEIAEMRRKTTQQPLHWISDASATWLDIYHFESRT